MSLSIKTHKTLWGRAAGRCSFPGCRLDVFHDEEEADDPTLIGENCHIVAEQDAGPRGDPTMPIERRNTYANLILMCRNHHRVIDSIPSGPRDYPVDRLHQIKRDHEEWVRNQLDFDAAKQRDDEYYAQIVDAWESRCHLRDWLAWSSSILSYGQPTMRTEVSTDLEGARRWLLNRIWPRRYESLEDAFENFRIVLENFHNLFLSQSEEIQRTLSTRRFYRIDEWDEERYHRLLARYEYHVDLVQDLMLELTRAANWVCDEVRSTLVHSYRRDEGHLLVQSGPNANLGFREWVVQYSAPEKALRTPFNGLDRFRDDRVNRDDHFGSGQEPR